jgi:hypothetical protein
VPYNLPLKIVIWSITILVSIWIGILFYIIAQKVKSESPSIARIKKGYGTFFLGWALTRVFFLLSDFELDRNGETSLYAVLLVTGYLFLLFALAILMYGIESSIEERKSLILTKIIIGGCVVNLIFWGLCLFTPSIITFAKYFGYSLGAVVGIIVIIFYFWLAKKSTGSLRKNVIINLLGITLIFLGQTLDSTYVVFLFDSVIWVPAIVSLVGVLVFYWSQKKSQ